MTILLDIDGVLVPESDEKPTIQADGFVAFNKKAAKNLDELIGATRASVVLTSNHRISFSTEKWIELFKARGVNIFGISRVNEIQTVFKMMDRGTEIKGWVDNMDFSANYVIIDDDHSIHALPVYIKDRWVMTDPLIGLDDKARDKALNILQNNADISTR